MRPLRQLRTWLSRPRVVPTWYHTDFRLPITSLGQRTKLDGRRADLVAWTLMELGLTAKGALKGPAPADWDSLALAHDPAWLERSTHAQEVARIMAVDVWDVPLAEVLRTVRLGVGATVAAAHTALAQGGPTLNLMGGFHHAGRAQAGGFCIYNDIAVAIAAVRAQGHSGMVTVLDLDAHPPDGTADCLRDWPDTWIGSLSGADWGPMPTVDETVLPEGCEDGSYLQALQALLGRMPTPSLCFVIAGGDVVADDALGPLGLSHRGAAQRDQAVLAALDGVPSVWLPGGGYGPRAWRVLARTALVLAGQPRRALPHDDPLRTHFSRIAAELTLEPDRGDAWITEADLADVFGTQAQRAQRVLDHYSVPGLELALWRYGFTHWVQRLGYTDHRVEVGATGTGDRFRVFGQAKGQEHMLLECVVARDRLQQPGDGPGLPVLTVHWLNSRHPAAAFGDAGPLPGQDVPGLGVGRELTEALRQMATRLEMVGVCINPSWYHVAYAARHDFAFRDPADQGRFEALLRDTAHLPLLQVTQAVAAGEMQCNGAPWTWAAEPMLSWLDGHRRGGDWQSNVDSVRNKTRFTGPFSSQG